jgi:hypothetical protein
VGQTLQAFGENSVHAIALGSFHRVGEQGQCRLVAAFSEVHLGGQGQPQPANRTSRSSSHRTAQQRPHFLHCGLARAAGEEGER